MPTPLKSEDHEYLLRLWQLYDGSDKTNQFEFWKFTVALQRTTQNVGNTIEQIERLEEPCRGTQDDAPIEPQWSPGKARVEIR